MQGDPDVLKLLNEQLTSELTAINQYFLHSKMQANWGFTELAEYTRKESFEEMQHAESITDRILLLDGLPNYQRLFSLRIGQTLREQFEADLAIEYEVVGRLRPGIIMCREKEDATSANLLEGILAERGGAHRLPRDPARADGQARRRAVLGPVRVPAAHQRIRQTFHIRSSRLPSSVA